MLQFWPYLLNNDYHLLHFISAINYFITPKNRVYEGVRLSDSNLVNYLEGVKGV